MESPIRRPTLADVASRAGTSTAVVSYVVNDGPRAVAPATRERVEQAIRELGYRRNPLAGALSNGHSNLVGLLVPDTANGFFGELSRCFEGEGRRRGLTTLLGNTGYEGAIAEQYVTSFSDLRPRGIFVTSIAPGIPANIPAPLVFVHSIPEDAAAPSVRFDDLGGARIAVEHLFSHGITDVHCLTGPHSGDPASLRQEGWRVAMESAGIETAGRLHLTSFDRVVAEADARALLTDRPWPRAIFATTDEQALAVLRAAVVVGARIPEDIALVSFDGIREATLGSTRLTTVRAPLERLASCAFDILEVSGGTAAGSTAAGSTAAGSEVGGTATSGETAGADATARRAEPQHLVLECELVIGETCGCPAAA